METYIDRPLLWMVVDVFVNCITSLENRKQLVPVNTIIHVTITNIMKYEFTEFLVQ